MIAEKQLESHYDTSLINFLSILFWLLSYCQPTLLIPHNWKPVLVFAHCLVQRQKVLLDPYIPSKKLAGYEEPTIFFFFVWIEEVSHCTSTFSRGVVSLSFPTEKASLLVMLEGNCALMTLHFKAKERRSVDAPPHLFCFMTWIHFHIAKNQPIIALAGRNAPFMASFMTTIKSIFGRHDWPALEWFNFSRIFG